MEMQITLDENPVIKTGGGHQLSFVVANETEIRSMSDEEETSYEVKIRNKFQHKKDMEIAPQVILHAIQTLVDDTKDILVKNKIKDVSPIVYLLNVHQADNIKEICKTIDLKEDILLSAFLKNTFEINFNSSLNDVLIYLCISDKISSEKIMPFLNEENKRNLESLLKIK